MTYTIKTARFDMNTKWGVALECDDGAVRRRMAVRINDGSLGEQEAVKQALPQLLEWAGLT